MDIPNYDNEKAHTVKMEAGSKIAGILGKSEFGVNTLHHQAVKDVAPSLKVVGRAPDGTVEALVVGAGPAVQELIAWAHQGPSAARVERVQVQEEALPVPAPQGFVQGETL